MRLRELDLFACRNLTDLSLLASLTELQAANLPAQINDLAFVRQLRSLRAAGQLGVVDAAELSKAIDVAEFFATQGRRLANEKQFGPRLDLLRTVKFGARKQDREVGLDSEGFLNSISPASRWAICRCLSGLDSQPGIRGTGATCSRSVG